MGLFMKLLFPPHLAASSLLHFILLLLIFNIVCKTKAVVKLPPNVSIPAVLVFGDSIVDTGNNNNLGTTARCNYPPYGKDFKGGTQTGQFSNGKVPSDFLGYNVGGRGCCGTGTIEVVFLCNSFTPSCPNDLEYVFWDSFNPTESVYKRLIACWKIFG